MTNPDNRTAAEIHGCDVTLFSSQQCFYGTYGCTASHCAPTPNPVSKAGVDAPAGTAGVETLGGVKP